jgi:AraC-like DNA-binding protein
MNSLAKLMSNLAPKEGINPSVNLEGVNFIRISNSKRVEPFIYNCSIAIISQGKKIAHFGDEVLAYDPNNYLVLSTPIPLECETVASPEEPLLGMTIDIDLKILHELISLIDESYNSEGLPKEHSKGVQSIPLDDDLSNVVKRLLVVMQNPQDCKVLAPNILREILYSILKNNKSLYAMTEHNTNFSRIARVLRNIHNNYSKNISIDDMANEAQMSVSSFHREFKKVTAESAIQYVKKLRLTKAKNLILQESLNANTAAYKVGYDNISQFSREFKRLFGNSPSSYINN